MRKSLFFSLFCVALLCGSCSDKKETGAKKESRIASIGQPSEVVLILDTEVLNSDLKDSLEGLLTVNVPALNQGEDYFRMSRIHESIDKGDFKRMHSRLIARINPGSKQPTLGVAYNVTANPQLEMLITAPSIDEMRPFVSRQADHIRELFLDHLLKSQAAYLKKHRSTELANDLRAMFGYTIDAPEEIKFTKKGENFLWGSSRSAEKQLNMVFYTAPLPFGGEAGVRGAALLRDSVMKANIPGSEPDQWMETVWEGDQPIVLAEEREVGGRRVFDMRGLWQMHNGAMGGPFVSIAFVDSVSQCLFVAEGFVYSPSTTKRDLVRRLEAALRTLRRK